MSQGGNGSVRSICVRVWMSVYMYVYMHIRVSSCYHEVTRSICVRKMAYI